MPPTLRGAHFGRGVQEVSARWVGSTRDEALSAGPSLCRPASHGEATRARGRTRAWVSRARTGDATRTGRSSRPRPSPGPPRAHQTSSAGGERVPPALAREPEGSAATDEHEAPADDEGDPDRAADPKRRRQIGERRCERDPTEARGARSRGRTPQFRGAGRPSSPSIRRRAGTRQRVRRILQA